MYHLGCKQAIRKIIFRDSLYSSPAVGKPVFCLFCPYRLAKGTDSDIQGSPALDSIKKSLGLGEFFVNFIGSENDDWTVRAAKTVEEAMDLLKVGFEYVTNIAGVNLFRKCN